MTGSSSTAGDARERGHGPWRLLSLPRVYTWFQKRVAIRDARAHVAAYIQARPGDRVLDIGCGPADILRFLPAVEYVGVDLSPRYLSEARRRYPHARFLEMDIRRLPSDWKDRFHLVLAQGVLHHFNDAEAAVLLSGVRNVMSPGGRLITVDPVFADDQGMAARMMSALDRGRHVRTVAQYAQLVRQVFDCVDLAVRHDLMRVPYTHLLMTCVRGE